MGVEDPLTRPSLVVGDIKEQVRRVLQHPWGHEVGLVLGERLANDLVFCGTVAFFSDRPGALLKEQKKGIFLVFTSCTIERTW